MLLLAGLAEAPRLTLRSVGLLLVQLTGCIASSFIAWLGALHPALFRAMWIIYIVTAAVLVLALFTDDAVRPFFRLCEPDYYALLIVISSALILGGMLSWLIGG